MNKQRGFTFLELLATLAVVGVILSVGVPSMGRMLAKHRLEAAATELRVNLLQARSQAITQDRTIYVSFSGTDKQWRYALGDSSACEPAAIANCTVNGAAKVFSGSTWQNVHMSVGGTSTEIAKSIQFNPRRGMAASTDTITLSVTNAGSIQVTISPIGHVNTCAPANGGVVGYPACSI